MDIASKVLSIILNKWLFAILDFNGTKYQFGGTPGVGCTEGNFTLKTLLHTRHNHNLATHAVFIDLVKACDTANHKLLLKVLRKYGVPQKLIDAVERLYCDLQVVFKIGKHNTEILQGVGVRQGDNMVPVLFLFLMNAFFDLVKIEYEIKGVEPIEMMQESVDTYRNGCIFRPRQRPAPDPPLPSSSTHHHDLRDRKSVV